MHLGCSRSATEQDPRPSWAPALIPILVNRGCFRPSAGKSGHFACWPLKRQTRHVRDTAAVACSRKRERAGRACRSRQGTRVRGTHATNEGPCLAKIRENGPWSGSRASRSVIGEWADLPEGGPLARFLAQCRSYATESRKATPSIAIPVPSSIGTIGVTVNRSHGVNGAVVRATVAALSASMIATPALPSAERRLSFAILTSRQV